VKYGSGWIGSGVNYHPHLIYVASSDDDVYGSLSRSNSMIYFESVADLNSPYLNYPHIAHQDMYRAVSSESDLTSQTELRSANNCDTPYSLSGATSGTCYNDGSGWYSSNTWASTSVSIAENEWVKITAYLKSNTYTSGVGNFDGIMKLWVNSQLAIDSTGVLFSAGSYEGSTWDKVILGPWIGDGSPLTQTMWLDELSIWTVSSSSSSTVIEPSPELRLD
jgi:hypothetical protein